jgi:hypothetical protein
MRSMTWRSFLVSCAQLEEPSFIPRRRVGHAGTKYVATVRKHSGRYLWKGIGYHRGLSRCIRCLFLLRMRLRTNR